MNIGSNHIHGIGIGKFTKYRLYYFGNIIRPQTQSIIEATAETIKTTAHITRTTSVILYNRSKEVEIEAVVFRCCKFPNDVHRCLFNASASRSKQSKCCHETSPDLSCCWGKRDTFAILRILVPYSYYNKVIITRRMQILKTT